MNGTGVTITSIGDTGRGAKWLLGIAGVLLVIGLPLIVLVGEIGAVIAGGIMTLVGLGLGVAGVRNKRLADRLAPGVLDVDRDQFTLGSRVPARFRRLVKQGSTDTQSITAKLVQTEWVRYRVDTDTRTVAEDVQVIDLPVTRGYDGRHVIGDLELAFPTYPPSFTASNNKVEWKLRVDITFLDGFTEDSVIPLWVIPAAARSDIGGAG